MHRTSALTFDPAAAQAWLHRPSGIPGFTVAESLGVDDELTGPGVEGFLSTVDDVLTAEPAGLHRRDDITDVLLWRIPDGDVLDQGALITVDLTNGIRLTTLHQDIKDFADRDQRGIPAVLSALGHIAVQVSQLMDAYEAANPALPGGAGGIAMTSETPTPRTPSTATADTGEGAFTTQQVLDALNTAADDILAAVDAGDEGLRDGINLMVNATIGYLRGVAADLHAIARSSYGEDLTTVLGWIGEAT